MPPEQYVVIIGKQRAHDEEVERTVEARFITPQAAIRREAAAAANAAVAGKLADAIKAKKQVEQHILELRTNFEKTVKQQLGAQAEALEKAANERVNAEKEKRFSESLKHEQELENLKRRMAKERPQELGDQGELDLFEVLTAEFSQDQIARVTKGVNGPDIVQRVLLNGVCIGVNAFECKNHRRWNSGWVGKLRQDAIEAGASHGILVTTAFPADKRELMVVDGIVVASPARALAVAHMLRRAVVQFHALKLSNEERDEKTARLYELLTSDRAAERWDRMSSATTNLLDIEHNDAAHQEKTRNKRVGLIRAMQAVHDEFTGGINAIIRGDPGKSP